VLVNLDRFGARTVLELASGQGWMTAALSRCGFDAQGLDADAARITAARLAHPELQFHHVGPLAPAPQHCLGRFDAVVGLQLRAAVPATDRLLQLALELLRPGGLLLLTVPRQGTFSAEGTLTAWLQRHGFEQARAEAVGFVAPVARTMLASARRPGG
jgi:2-polyprenyl-6-hydroxyphenyl methylase/3-demethylubiquinone-9 3-methyltransferase